MSKHDASPSVGGCGYQGYEFGGGYLDSICIDGCLHDADNCDGEGNIYLNDEGIPCPMCRPLDAMDWWTEQNTTFCDDDAKRAREAAVNLVIDIRRNRGVETDLSAIALTTGESA